MTRAERKAAEASYKALMKRVRALSARLSRGAIREVDSVVAEVSASLSKIGTSSEPLSAAKAEAMLNRLRTGLDRIEAQWLASSAKLQNDILSTVIREHKTVAFQVARVLEVPTGGVALRLSTVPGRARKAVASALRGNKTVGRLIRGHMGEIGDGFGAYLENATGVKSSAEALAGMRRLLRGELPIDLAGTPKVEAKLAASIGWKVERLLATEGFETYRQGNAAALRAAPVKLVAKWELSERHEVPDECDDVAKEDVGFGPGWYPPEEWPDAPHPNCQCGQGEIRVVTEEG